jgi:hypothetical protein
MLTAQEAKALADNNKIVEKMVRKILRQVYKRAKRGGYSLEYSSPYGKAVDNRICERLRGLGYRACTSVIGVNIFVYWSKVGEE